MWFSKGARAIKLNSSCTFNVSFKYHRNSSLHRRIRIRAVRQCHYRKQLHPICISCDWEDWKWVQWNSFYCGGEAAKIGYASLSVWFKAVKWHVHFLSWHIQSQCLGQSNIYFLHNFWCSVIIYPLSTQNLSSPRIRLSPECNTKTGETQESSDRVS